MTPQPERVVLAWSGGKDSALALECLRADPGVQVAGLLTTVTEGTDEVVMHRVPNALLLAQCAAVGLAQHAVSVPAQPSNAVYATRMGQAVAELQRRGVSAVAFGDLHLADVREYREQQLAGSGVRPVFPLWGEDTTALLGRFVAAGHRAVVVCVDSEALDPRFVGRELDAAFLADLPGDVDPCGENGEYHSFVYDGPGFAAAVPFRRAAVSDDGRFWYQALTAP